MKDCDTSKAVSKKKKKKRYYGAPSKTGEERPNRESQGVGPEAKRRRPNSTVNGLIGAKGFLVTCDIGRDRRAARQIEQAIREVVVEKRGEAKSHKDRTSIGSSVADTIAQELKESKEKGVQVRFQELESRRGFFMATLDNAEDLDAVSIAAAIVHVAMQSKKTLAPECIRVVPLQIFCPSNIEAMKTALTPLLSDAFKLKKSENATFAINFKRRFSETPKRSDVLSEMAPFIQATGAKEGVTLKVDLSVADFTIIIEIYKSIAGVSVVQHFKELMCFNLRKAEAA